MSRLLAKVLREEASAPVVEYGLVAALIAAVLLTAASLAPSLQPAPDSPPALRAAPR
jgi:Flp pilus assembly pilin Flp